MDTEYYYSDSEHESIKDDTEIYYLDLDSGEHTFSDTRNFSPSISTIAADPGV